MTVAADLLNTVNFAENVMIFVLILFLKYVLPDLGRPMYVMAANRLVNVH